MNEFGIFPFIQGETIDLCVPTEEAITVGGWHNWLNNSANLEYSQRGAFPVSKFQQYEFLENSFKDNSRLVLLIHSKKEDLPAGVISIQSIDFRSKSGELAILVGSPERLQMPPINSLEAVFRITEHAFEILGLDRIYAGQAYPGLKGWNKMLEIAGYFPEGIEYESFVKGSMKMNSVRISINRKRYEMIRGNSNKYWCGISTISNQLKSLGSRDSLAEMLSDFIGNLHSKALQSMLDENKT